MRIQNNVNKPAVLSSRLLVWVIAVLFVFSTNPVQSQNELFKTLKDSYNVNAELYFYASTLRMINISRDPNFDELVRDIDKMTFYQLDELPSAEIRQFVSQLYSEYGFEEMITVDSKEETIYVVGKEESEFIAIIKSGGFTMAVDLEGKIRVDKIPELVNSLNADSFLNVFEIGKDERREHADDSN